MLVGMTAEQGYFSIYGHMLGVTADQGYFSIYGHMVGMAIKQGYFFSVCRHKVNYTVLVK